MKTILIILFATIISTVASSQLVTTQSEFDFDTQITADSSGYVISAKTITFNNVGAQTVVIDAVYTLPTNSYLTLGGTKNTLVIDTLDITFTGTGTKILNIIKENNSRK